MRLLKTADLPPRCADWVTNAHPVSKTHSQLGLGPSLSPASPPSPSLISTPGY